MYKKSILLCLAILFLVNFNYSLQAKDVFIIRGKIDWKTMFADPFEIVYLILYDTTVLGMTTQEEQKINISASYIEKFLEADGYDLGDVAIMVHNHFPMPFFSWGNGIILKRLRNRGFKGSFGVYHIPTDTIKWADRDGN